MSKSSSTAAPTRTGQWTVRLTSYPHIHGFSHTPLGNALGHLRFPISSPAPPLPCPTTWSLHDLGVSPALSHTPRPIGCRLSSHLQYQRCSFTCFHLGPHPSDFCLLAPSGHETLPEGTPGHTSVQSLVQDPFLSLVTDPSEPPGSVPPHDPLCPIPLASSLVVISALISVTFFITCLLQ